MFPKRVIEIYVVADKVLPFILQPVWGSASAGLAELSSHFRLYWYLIARTALEIRSVQPLFQPILAMTGAGKW